MRIKLNLKIFIFIIIFYFTKQIEIYALLMIFALVHELGHILVGVVLGLKPKTLKIMPFGVSIEFEKYTKNEKETYEFEKQKILIALAGPLVNILIVIISLLIHTSFLGALKETIIYANILIGMFNLLPIYPLDGGRILKSILHMRYKIKMATILINKISNAVMIILTIISSIAILYFKNIAILIILAYLWYLVIQENKTYKFKMRVYNIMEK